MLQHIRHDIQAKFHKSGRLSIGINDKLVDLGFKLLDHMQNDRFGIQFKKSFLAAPHATGLSARDNGANDFHGPMWA